ncbi:MAG: OFA family MFS transporter [Candidatus Micrarchaeia archaeon]
MDARAKAGWTVVAGGVLINLMLGVTYTWSVFAGPLAQEYGWSQTEVQLAFSVMLAAFALSMIPAGMLIDRYGPRIVALAGGLLLAAGFIATGLFATTPLLLYITYGLLAGAGVGLAYGTPISAGMKWFEKGKGLVSGIIVFGFGFGSLLLAPVAKELIISQGIQQAFLMLGLVFAAVVSFGAMLLKNPEEYKPTVQAKGLAAFGILKKRDFWLLWVMFAFSSAAGLMVIGNLATFAKLSFSSTHGMDADSAFSLAALAVGVLAVFNGLGRIFAGWLSDRIGRPKTMLLAFGVQAIAVASIASAGVYSPLLLLAVMCIVGLCFGANFSLFPAATADFFGTTSSGVNYGLMFTAYGIGGIIGPQAMAYSLDAAKASTGVLGVGAYATPFLFSAALVGIAALMSLLFVKKS